ncbi:type II toxin-antitoxin system YafQ family toxin [candidate division KSB1 bacterium]|nr:type II toxin-antitoxin system YafQ family toxin [candidate division KSB1 bacterium]
MKIRYTTRFKKDYKKITNQNKNKNALKQVMEILAQGKKLPSKFNDHKLIGEWNNHRDCHIESDWLLIYRLTKDTLILERTGTHAGLFG